MLTHLTHLCVCLSRQAIGMLLASYGTAIALAVRMPGAFNTPVMAGGHAVLALALVFKVRSVASCVASSYTLLT